MRKFLLCFIQDLEGKKYLFVVFISSYYKLKELTTLVDGEDKINSKEVFLVDIIGTWGKSWVDYYLFNRTKS